VSSKSSPDKIDMLRAMGAKVYVCPAHVSADDPRSYYQVAKRMHEEMKGSVYINQYFNQLNMEAHYRTTGPEIWEQTNGQITHLIACSGTGGTISGTGRFLKEMNPNIKVIGVDAYGSVLKKYHETREFDTNEIYPYRIEGLGKNLIPGATDFDVIDKFVKVTDEESAHTARMISKTEGCFVGYTSGAAFQAAKQLAEQGEFDKDSNVILIFPDHGSRYMSKIYSDMWMRDQGFFDAVNTETTQKIEYIKYNEFLDMSDFNLVDKVNGITKEEFKEQYISTQRPVIFKDLTKDWLAREKWTFDFFRKRYGDWEIPMYDDSYHNPGKGYMKPTTYKRFEDYLNIVENEPTNLRFHNFQVMKRAPELANDYTTPKIMGGFLRFALMFFGGKGSALNLHYDIDCSHVFLTHLRTQKVVFLYPPNQSDLLYKLPYTNHSHVNVLK